MWGYLKLMDVVFYPELQPNYGIIRDEEGNLDVINIIVISILIVFVIVLSFLIIRRIRRGM